MVDFLAVGEDLEDQTIGWGGEELVEEAKSQEMKSALQRPPT